MKKPNKYKYTDKSGVIIESYEYIRALENYIGYLEDTHAVDKGVSDEEKSLLKEFIEYAYENTQLNDNNRETFANLYANASNIVDGLCAEKAQVAPKPQEAERVKEVLIDFMKWYKECVPIGTRQSAESLVKEFLATELKQK